MIRDDARLTLAFGTPPENDDVAEERVQLMNEDYKRIEILRKAAIGPPQSYEEALEVVKAAGPYPSNLLGMWWNTVDEFVRVLKTSGWVVEEKLIKHYKGQTTPYEVVIKSPEHGVRFEAVAMTPTATKVVCCRVLYSSNEEWKRYVNGEEEKE
jgi:hypothetical protein